MKNYIYLPFILLLGLVVGGWGVRTDLRLVKDELKEAKKNMKSGEVRARNVQIAGEVTQLLNIEQGASARRRKVRPKRSEEQGSTSNVVSETEGIAGGETVKVAKPRGDRRRRDLTEAERQDSFEQDINQAVELFEVRSKIARKTFVGKVQLDEKQEERFDVLVDAMNVRLADKIEKWSTGIEGKDDVGPEDGVRLVHGVTEVMVSAYEDMDRDMPEGWREKSGGELNMTDFIDPAVALPLANVGEKMQGIGPSSDFQEEGEF
jgi:hypothetical protein